MAKFLKQKKLFDRIWFVVSPNNPLKNINDLMDENDRLNMVKLAIQNFPYMFASAVEFSLPKPSFTVDTLYLLENQYFDYEFSLIIGNDNMENFHKWKNYEKILQQYMIYVYPRNNETFAKIEHPHIVYLDAPLLPVSATQIRNLLAQGKSATKYLPKVVVQYLETVKILNLKF
jgi:nicotinate-nucleotide adenylyltransferase